MSLETHSNIISISLPDTIVNIGGWSFKGCSNLAEINIPNGVTSIDVWAFQQCSSIKEIDIPDNLTYVGHDAFWGCSAVRHANKDTKGAKALSKAGYSFRTEEDDYSLKYLFEDDTVVGVGLYDVNKEASIEEVG